MKHFISGISKATVISLSLFLQIIIFLGVTLIIFFLSYLIGYQYLQGDSLMGNDAFSFYTIADWISAFYPAVPFWFPHQGAGISFTGYPWFAAYLVNTIAYLSSLNLVSSFRILGLISVPLTGIGIFVFAWIRLTEVKSVFLRQLIGLIASIFYVTAPVSWIWLFQWGFYAEQVSLIFVPWIFLFMDLFIHHLFINKNGFFYRLGLVGTILFAVLGFLTHFYVGITTLFIFIILVIVYTLNSKINLIVLYKRVLPILFLFTLLFSGAVAFRYYSYSRYMQNAAQGGLVGGTNVASNREGTAESLLTPEMMLSLEKDSSAKLLKPRDTIRNMRFPFYVWVLLIPTLLFGLFRSKKMFAFAVVAVVGFIANTNVDAYILFSSFPVLNKIPILNQVIPIFTGRQFFVPGRIMIPLAAAYGAFVFWDLIGSIILRLHFKSKYLRFYTNYAVTFFCLLGTILTIGFTVSQYYNLPYPKGFVNAGSKRINILDPWEKTVRPGAIYTKQYTESEEQFLSNNPEYRKIADYIYIDYLCTYDGPGKPTTKVYPKGHLCNYYKERISNNKTIFPSLDFLQRIQRECSNIPQSEYGEDRKYCKAFYASSVIESLSVKQWPIFSVSPSIDAELKAVTNFFAPLPKNEKYRYDVSGYSARTIMSTPLVNKNSQIQIYINSLSLMHNLANYQSQVMYSNFPLYQKPGVLTEIGKWYGIDYVYLSGTPLEPHNYWADDINWQKISDKNKEPKKEINNNEGWKKFSESTGYLSWSNKPLMLVITDNSRFFYDESFKFFTRGGLKYEQAIPVLGKKNVDDYSLSELQNYEIIFMRSYGYRNRGKAYRLLDSYIKNGGKLIFDTGWQYYVPDYELTNAPDFMPFPSLKWTNLSPSSFFKIEDADIGSKIDAEKFGNMKYENSSWGVSVPDSLRDWAKSIVTYNDKPVIAGGDYGKGKVIWIGFNIVAHSEAKDSLEEAYLFNNLINTLLNNKTNIHTFKIKIERNHPDQILLTADQSLNSSSNIYLREAFYPDWKASLISNNHKKTLTIKRAGPGFMLIQLPPILSGDIIKLEIKSSTGQQVANLISLLTGISLLVYLVSPRSIYIVKLIISKFKFSVLINKLPITNITTKAKGKISNISRFEADENDY